MHISSYGRVSPASDERRRMCSFIALKESCTVGIYVSRVDLFLMRVDRTASADGIELGSKVWIIKGPERIFHWYPYDWTNMTLLQVSVTYARRSVCQACHSWCQSFGHVERLVREFSRYVN